MRKSLDHKIYLLMRKFYSLTFTEGAIQQKDNLRVIWRVSWTTSYHRYQVDQQYSRTSLQEQEKSIVILRKMTRCIKRSV